MSDSDLALWAFALVVGGIVIAGSIIMLEAFTRLVIRIEETAERIWVTGKQVAANTAVTWMLGQTSERLDEIAEEAGRHGQLLGTTEEG